mmetsp:Transcript_18521/g.52006  ORF Transcript_18521/g.52006 Transcript_18521/m.52006 type:complete len:226 (+) Transcript_18521:3295-3972(+)
MVPLWPKRRLSMGWQRRHLRSTRSLTKRWRPSWCCWSTSLRTASSAPSTTPPRSMRRPCGVSLPMRSSGQARWQRRSRPTCLPRIPPTTRRWWRRPRARRCMASSSSTCSWSARSTRTPRSTLSLYTRMPRPTRSALWRISSALPTKPTCRRAETGSSTRASTRLPASCSNTSPTGHAWRQPWSNSTASRLPWTLRAKPTAPAAGRRSCLPAWMPRSSAWRSWRV